MANRYVELVHRHHGPVTAGPASFSVAAVDPDSLIRGVATAGIPNAANRLTDGFRTLEVVRVATDGCPNACSVLYAACGRAAKALGFSRVITYILDTESGTSVKAAGWQPDEGDFGNLSWANRPGRTGSNFGPKGRWSLDINGCERPELLLPEHLRVADSPTLFSIEGDADALIDMAHSARRTPTGVVGTNDPSPNQEKDVSAQ